MLSLQEKFAPSGICFGCGCKNSKGLQIKSYIKKKLIVCNWSPKSHHEAFPGILNGGIIGALFDCHSNWSAAHFLMIKNKASKMPCTVTASFSVNLLHPTPSNSNLFISASLNKISARSAEIKAEIHCNNLKTATCVGSFVSVLPNHPAYHRW